MRFALATMGMQPTGSMAMQLQCHAIMWVVPLACPPHNLRGLGHPRPPANLGKQRRHPWGARASIVGPTPGQRPNGPHPPPAPLGAQKHMHQHSNQQICALACTPGGLGRAHMGALPLGVGGQQTRRCHHCPCASGWLGAQGVAPPALLPWVVAARPGGGMPWGYP